MTNINLLTHEELKAQTQKKALRLGTLLSLAFLAIIVATSVYYYLRTSAVKNSLKTQEAQIGKYRREISALAPIEITSRNLYEKYSVVHELLAERSYNSLLLETLRSKVPAGVAIESFAFASPTTISLAGVAPNYVAVSTLLSNFMQPEDPRVFTSATLRSVVLNAGDRTVRFSIVVSFDPDTLKIYE